jgi:hypothetical protein
MARRSGFHAPQVVPSWTIASSLSRAPVKVRALPSNLRSRAARLKSEPSESFASDQPSVHAGPDHRLEELPKDVAFPGLWRLTEKVESLPCWRGAFVVPADWRRGRTTGRSACHFPSARIKRGPGASRRRLPRADRLSCTTRRLGPSSCGQVRDRKSIARSPACDAPFPGESALARPLLPSSSLMHTTFRRPRSAVACARRVHDAGGVGAGLGEPVGWNGGRPALLP